MFRNVSSPDQALSSTLRNFADRLGRLERRIRWPGATRLDAPASPVALPGDDTWYTFCTLTLDPGAWLLLAGATFEVPTDGVTAGVYEVSARTTPTTPGGTSFASGKAELSVTTIDALVVQTSVTLAEAGDVTFDLRYVNYTFGAPNASVIDPYLLAFPA